MEQSSAKALRRIHMMEHVIRDEDTDEIVGLADDASEEDKKEWQKYLKEQEQPAERI